MAPKRQVRRRRLRRETKRVGGGFLELHVVKILLRGELAARDIMPKPTSVATHADERQSVRCGARDRDAAGEIENVLPGWRLARQGERRLRRE